MPEKQTDASSGPDRHGDGELESPGRIACALPLWLGMGLVVGLILLFLYLLFLW